MKKMFRWVPVMGFHRKYHNLEVVNNYAHPRHAVTMRCNCGWRWPSA